MDRAPYPIEGRRKLSEYRKKNQFGKSNPFYGKRHTDENKESYSNSKIGKGNPRWIGHYIIDDVEYISTRSAASGTGVSKTSILRRCKSPAYPNYIFIPKELTHEQSV